MARGYLGRSCLRLAPAGYSPTARSTKSPGVGPGLYSQSTGALHIASGPERLVFPGVGDCQFSNIGAIKASGLANEVAGKAKQGVGNVVGSDKLKSEGAAQELKGAVQKATGDVKAGVKDAANKTADALNKKL
jgi:uncharacterized protein YjbJ (UPF0337 family)